MSLLSGNSSPPSSTEPRLWWGNQFLSPFDADKILERQGHAGLLVGLELWQIDDEVRGQDRFTEQIGVAPATMMLRRRAPDRSQPHGSDSGRVPIQ